MKSRRTLPSSFRDPSGFLFAEDGRLFRQVNPVYKDNYDSLIGSGLYRSLAGEGLLIPHEEAELAEMDGAYKVLRPEVLPFVSYPYEWSFSQLKDAALATLRIQKRALDFGMSLKDASVYNVQFQGGKPLLIDTLSFEQYREGEPWVAYRQFCQHFLAPLALMSRKDVRLNQLLRVYIDGV
ncbi:MAG: SAM-dependent methyltransferase, partial [Chloroflexota bacterium]